MTNTIFDHGDPNWDKIVNQKLIDLSAATKDTGWVDLNLLNGFSNLNSTKTQIRMIGHTCYLKVEMNSLTTDTVAFVVPTTFKPVPIQAIGRTTGGYAFPVTLQQSGEFQVESSKEWKTQPTDYLKALLIWNN
ncbi:hypothetical protein RA086_05665 [Lactiplantibacillus sp. WILCCON 0030]|uniref:Uncharacterized protein n=1 Tax=Lactiplantibacillus brownii TaxID=3069269 RepID=A0ABU1A826_9LACO|nr:hypothetical protein [Lactiplantibacillus brownii]MDQ7937114.1 hypothetical protein [Lactiplantibacillus brownii]